MQTWAFEDGIANNMCTVDLSEESLAQHNPAVVASWRGRAFCELEVKVTPRGSKLYIELCEGMDREIILCSMEERHSEVVEMLTSVGLTRCDKLV